MLWSVVVAVVVRDVAAIVVVVARDAAHARAGSHALVRARSAASADANSRSECSPISVQLLALESNQLADESPKVPRCTL